MSTGRLPDAAFAFDPNRLTVVYELAAADADAASARAQAIAREQTVEIPRGVVDETFESRLIGQLCGVTGGDGQFRVAVTYDPALVCSSVSGSSAGQPRGRFDWRVDLPQLLNLLYGNVSMWQGVTVAEVGWPASVLARLPGPRFGIDGLRALCGVPRRPLLCGALKPLGLDATALAQLAARAAHAGVDLVKDDHSLADQPYASWSERVARCADAIAVAAAAAGTRTVYVPNLTGPVDQLAARLERLATLGVRAALVAPALLGFDQVRALAEAAAPQLVLLGHPSFSGSWLATSAGDGGANGGLAATLLWGDLFRLAGCDGVIYPNAGGRFPIDLATATAVHRRLRAPLGAHRPSFPCLGGGVEPAAIGGWVERYGCDTIFLVGGGIYRDPDPRRAAERILTVLRQHEATSTGDSIAPEQAEVTPPVGVLVSPLPAESRVAPSCASRTGDGTDPVAGGSRVVRAAGTGWEGVAPRLYKQVDPAAGRFRDVTRHELLGPSAGDNALNVELRAFALAPGGRSSLERHQHPHVVAVARGAGAVLLGHQVERLATGDVVYVAPLTWHQFAAANNCDLVFWCVVDTQRDRPEVASDDVVAALGESLAELEVLLAT